MAAVRPVVIVSLTIVLVWSVGAGFGTMLSLRWALSLTGVWLLWSFGRRRSAVTTGRLLWAVIGLAGVLALLHPGWRQLLVSLSDAFLHDWSRLADRWAAREPLGFGVTGLPLLAMAEWHRNACTDCRGDSRRAFSIVTVGFVATLLAGSYRWEPVWLGAILYAPLAFGFIAYAKAEELAFARYRGDVRRALLLWSIGLTLSLAIGLAFFGDASGPLAGVGWRPEPGVSRSDAVGSPPEEFLDTVGLPDMSPEGMPTEVYVGDGEPGELHPLFYVYVGLMLLVLVVAGWQANRWATRRRWTDSRSPSELATQAEFPEGPWRTVVLIAFLWLVRLLSGRAQPRRSLTATEQVTTLIGQRPALAAPLQRLLAQFLPVRYGPPGWEPNADLATVRQDWDDIQQHVREEAGVGRGRLWHRLSYLWRRRQ